MSDTPLRVGAIGFGGRGSGMIRGLGVFDVPYRVAAIVDPREEEIRQAHGELVADTVFYESADAMLEEAGLDGVMIATRCHLHADLACKVAARGLPLFLEKPVAITFDQLKRLDAAFRDYPAPTLVSFPLRTSPIAEKVKEVVDSGAIGTVEHVVAWNDVPYAIVYYKAWYRNYDEMGGLFLQKATHDLDCIQFLLGRRPRWISAMKAQRVYGGDKPHDLRCRDCELNRTCPESPFVQFFKNGKGERVQYTKTSDWCAFSREIRNEDLGQCMLEYDGGAQATYTQNFFARNKAARRGARLYGYDGTIEFDWYENKIHLFSHRRPTVETIDFGGGLSHFGGDRELQYDFLMAMKKGQTTRAPMEAGILSALTCLWARDSAESREFREIAMP